MTQRPELVDPTSQGGLTGLPYAASPLRTRRLLLRAFEPSDLGDVVKYQSREEVVRYLGWGVLDRAGSSRHLDERIKMNRLESDGDWLVHAVELVDVPIGHPRVVGEVIIYLKSVVNAQLEVGWIFNPIVQGHGLATEAAAAILSLCFNTLEAHRVIAQLYADNTASARLCDRLGMRHEALLREDQLFKGAWASTSVYALLRSEHCAGTPAQVREGV